MHVRGCVYRLTACSGVSVTADVGLYILFTRTCMSKNTCDILLKKRSQIDK